MSRYAELGIEMLEKANADLEPDLLTQREAERAFAIYDRAERLAAYGKAALARRLDAAKVARASGTSIGKARAVVATGEAMESAPELGEAVRSGELSFDQAAEIAGAVTSAPEAVSGLIDTARSESFHVLRDTARRVKLEAEQHHDLAARQKAARRAGSHVDALGMVHINLAFQPHVGAPIASRAEADAQRRLRAAKRAAREGQETVEPFERYLADAYAAALAGGTIEGPGRRSDLVVLVSQEVAERGWNEVRAGETCKIPGVGPIDVKEAKEIARRAFVNAVVCDGKDLRHFKRWTRSIPVEVRLALELGDPPQFDGIRCVDCGNRFRTEIDHVEPFAAGGPTSYMNNEPRCWPCHLAKTESDRKAGKLNSAYSKGRKPPPKDPPRPEPPRNGPPASRPPPDPEPAGGNTSPSEPRQHANRLPDP